MSYNSYNAALKSYEENGPNGKEGKNVLVYSSDRTMKQHSALGATCNFKSAASVCVMDFESSKWKWNRANKNSSARGRTSKCLVCISNDVQRHHSSEQMNHHRRRCYTYYARIHVCGYMIKKVIPPFLGPSLELEMSRISIGKVMSAFSDDLKRFCAPASQNYWCSWKLASFFCLKTPTGCSQHITHPWTW